MNKQFLASLCASLCIACNNNSYNNGVPVLSTDTTFRYDEELDCLEIRKEEREFLLRMYKGVQGDFTLEQVDSMEKVWSSSDSI